MKGGETMKKGLKIAGIVLGGFILLAIIIAAIPGGDKKLEETNKNLKETNQQLQEQIKEQVEPKNNQPQPTNEPVREKEWQNVKTFEGDGDTDQTTANFTIIGSEWRVRWWYIQDIPNSTSIFGGNIYTKDRKRVGSWTGTEPSKTATDFRETYVKTGPGEYYLKIVGGNTGAWEVDVEEFKEVE